MRLMLGLESGLLFWCWERGYSCRALKTRAAYATSASNDLWSVEYKCGRTEGSNSNRWMLCSVKDSTLYPTGLCAIALYPDSKIAIDIQ
jgi:hypothetical protein